MTKKRTTQKKTSQEAKPILRFREIGNDKMEMFIDHPKKRTLKKKPIPIEAELLRILEDIEKNIGIENNAVLTEHLLRFLRGYFYSKAREQNAALLKKIGDKFFSLSLFFKQGELRKKLKTDEKNLAVGQFSEALIYFGMPRIRSIQATAEWLELGKSTVRIANEKYRKRTKLLAKAPNFENRLYLSQHMSLFIEWFKEHPRFPTGHPRSEVAFKKLHEFVFRKIHQRLETQN